MTLTSKTPPSLWGGSFSGWDHHFSKRGAGIELKEQSVKKEVFTMSPHVGQPWVHEVGACSSINPMNKRFLSNIHLIWTFQLMADMCKNKKYESIISIAPTLICCGSSSTFVVATHLPQAAAVTNSHQQPASQRDSPMSVSSSFLLETMPPVGYWFLWLSCKSACKS